MSSKHVPNYLNHESEDWEHKRSTRIEDAQCILKDYETKLQTAYAHIN